MPGYELDHIALAGADTAPALRFLTGDLGGTVIFGGQAYGFRPMQVWIGTPDGDGMSIELLEPWEVERNDFLAWFVERHGAGPHHMTFKVPSLTDAIERVRAAGYKPVNIDVSDPEWKEAFLMPREAHGTVVQLAETTHDGDRAQLLAYVAENGPNEHPRWWTDPMPASGPPARLRRIVLRTPNLSSALGLFSGLLRGDVVDSDAHSAELRWPSGSRLRLEERTDDAPGVDRLEIEGLSNECAVLGTRFVPAPA